MTACPYYSAASFGILAPLAVVYSLASHAFRNAFGGHFLVGNHHNSYYQPAAGYSLPPPLAPEETRIAIVTGSNTGIGFQTARSLAVDYGYTVVLACRSRDKAQQAVDEIRRDVSHDKNKALSLQPLDLSSLQSVRDFVSSVHTKYGPESIHVLVNNAGRNTNDDEPTVDGLDALFQANFVGHYVLTRELLDRNLLAPKARVVNLSSVMHHFVGGGNHDLSDVSFWKSIAKADSQSKFGDLKYSLSKVAAIFFSMELNRRYGDRLQAISVNPGAVNSDIWRDMPRIIIPLFRLVYLNSQQGSHTSVTAAVADFGGSNNSGSPLYLQPYWLPVDKKETPMPLYEMLGPFEGSVVTEPRLPGADQGRAAARALWEACEELTTLVDDSVCTKQ